MYDKSDEFDWYEDDRIRTLIERGDMGYCPGDCPDEEFTEFPRIAGTTLRGKIWQASMGNSEDIHIKYLERKENQAMIFSTKIRARRKLSKMRKIEARRFGVSDITLDDPDILPRHMEVKELVNIISAVEYANVTKGIIFNVSLTLNWKDLGCGDEAGDQQLYDLFIKPFSEWCRECGIDCVWIYSNEVGDYVGLHTHFMTSIPQDKLPSFKEYIGKRMAKIDKSKALPRGAYYIKTNKKRGLKRQWVQVQYLCKGVNPYGMLKHANGFEVVFASDLIQFGYESPGQVTCKKRCGVSRNIDKKAREQAGFKSRMEKGLLNVDILYSNYSSIERERSVEEIGENLKRLNI